MKKEPANIKKRNGTIVPFDFSKIRNAIEKANAESTDETLNAAKLDKLTRVSFVTSLSENMRG